LILNSLKLIKMGSKVLKMTKPFATKAFKPMMRIIKSSNFVHNATSAMKLHKVSKPTFRSMSKGLTQIQRAGRRKMKFMGTRTPRKKVGMGAVHLMNGLLATDMKHSSSRHKSRMPKRYY